MRACLLPGSTRAIFSLAEAVTFVTGFRHSLSIRNDCVVRNVGQLVFQRTGVPETLFGLRQQSFQNDIR